MEAASAVSDEGDGDHGDGDHDDHYDDGGGADAQDGNCHADATVRMKFCCCC